ncbi:F420-dependent oxidoreductase [Nocardioides sp. JQ2195]|uniref:coenzyme F420-0:L-glutamate ligase n=1 Tax=Nocardioides sp. JQ2195 TaxID=2592334 RepID=UPI00143EA3B6|nr:coenzyme F420-0:L-glutamate ligase [Nocardioides sp. JQ2195]QIX25940.1 F420-dependent oxidoreductase [Nocardioides sp. JQ2195]
MTVDPGRHELVVVAPDGIGEVLEGDDLAALALSVCDLVDGDVLTITSKVVSKAEGRRRTGDRLAGIAGETVRVVARRGPTTIVRNHLGLTMAAAGIDASNVTAGDYLLLPADPDRTARAVRAAIAERTGANVGVLITDTAGRAWRNGQGDIAIGAAGLLVLEDFAGRDDAYGNALAVTAPAVADELAGAAELASGKLAARPFAVIRGRADLVLPSGEDGSGASALVRADGADMFGYGTREAVVHALSGTGGEVFGSPALAEDLAIAVTSVLGQEAEVSVLEGRVRTSLSASAADVQIRLEALAFAFGWRLSSTPVPDDPPGSRPGGRPGGRPDGRMVEVTFLPSSP